MNTPPCVTQTNILRALLVGIGVFLAALGTVAEVTAADIESPTIGDFMQNNGRVQIIAHRGFSGRAPENTVAAIREAIEVGADMAEIDVSLTADDQIVCLHDDKVNRTTNGKGHIAELTLAEAQRLDAGSWFSPAFAGERIPTLDAVLEAAKGHILLNIEIKPETVESGIAARVVDTVKAHGMQDQVVISSFSPDALAQVHALDEHLLTASLYNRKLHRGIDPGDIVGEANSTMLNINRHYLKEEIRERCLELGIPIGVYTANKRKKMAKLVDMGVHAIFTNHPDLLLEVLEEQTPATETE